jgi:hypothetical protein
MKPRKNGHRSAKRRPADTPIRRHDSVERQHADTPIRRHVFPLARIIYITLFILLFSCAGYFRFRLPQEPFIDPDVDGYLGPGLLALTGNGFQHIEGRSFVYPGFVYLILAVFRDFRAITIVQHLSGLAAGGVLLACWDRCFNLIPRPITPKPVYRILGLLVAALFLFNTSVVRLEHLIRPEAIFPLFAALSAFFDIQFIQYRFLKKESRLALIYGMVTIFNACLLFYLKPSFYLATAVATLPVWVSFLDPREALRRKLVLTGIAAVSVLALLSLPEYAVGRTDPDSKTFLPTTLFVVHANIIRDQLAKDIASGANTPYPPQLLENTYELLDQEIKRSKQTGHYTSLGFDPDYLMYEDSFDRKFSSNLKSQYPDDSRGKFYYYYFFRTWIHQPGRMLKKVARQFSILYNNIGKASPYKLEDHKKLSAAYISNSDLFQKRPSLFLLQYQPLQAFMKSCNQLTGTRSQLDQPMIISWINSFLARTLTVSLLLALLLLFILAKDPDLRTNYGWFLAATLLLFGYSFADTLGIAIIHTLEITRYLTNQLIHCLLPQCLTFFLAVEIWSVRRLRHRQIEGKVSAVVSVRPEPSDRKTGKFHKAALKTHPWLDCCHCSGSAWFWGRPRSPRTRVSTSF